MNDLLYKVLRQLMLNSLVQLRELLDKEGYGNLSQDDPLLYNIDVTGLKILTHEWRVMFPEEALRLGNQMPFNKCLIDTLIKKIEDEMREK